MFFTVSCSLFNIFVYTLLMQGIKAVLAESYERIHRSNLIGMGILPLQYLNSKDIICLKQAKMETFTIEIPFQIKPKQHLQIQVHLYLYQ